MILQQAIENKRTRDLSEEELTKLRDEVEKYSVEGDLRRFTALNIKRLKEIGCYRGRRHVQVRVCLRSQHMPAAGRWCMLSCRNCVLCRAHASGCSRYYL